MSKDLTVTLTEPQVRALIEASDVAADDLIGKYAPFGSLYYRTKAATLVRARQRLTDALR